MPFHSIVDVCIQDEVIVQIITMPFSIRVWLCSGQVLSNTCLVLMGANAPVAPVLITALSMKGKIFWDIFIKWQEKGQAFFHEIANGQSILQSFCCTYWQGLVDI